MKKQALSIEQMNHLRELGLDTRDATPEDVWEWWISKESVEKYLLRKKQAKLF